MTSINIDGLVNSPFCSLSDHLGAVVLWPGLSLQAFVFINKKTPEGELQALWGYHKEETGAIQKEVKYVVIIKPMIVAKIIKSDIVFSFL